ncbi:MAG: hypothetical protein HY043_11375 [Verrucomicrobia bacterium]|nr:hypothetical protein [Verrucomicrobiota bacterium]
MLRCRQDVGVKHVSRILATLNVRRRLGQAFNDLKNLRLNCLKGFVRVWERTEKLDALGDRFGKIVNGRFRHSGALHNPKHEFGQLLKREVHQFANRPPRQVRWGCHADAEFVEHSRADRASRWKFQMDKVALRGCELFAKWLREFVKRVRGRQM